MVGANLHFQQLVTSTVLLCLSWNSVAVANENRTFPGLEVNEADQGSLLKFPTPVHSPIAQNNPDLPPTVVEPNRPPLPPLPIAPPETLPPLPLLTPPGETPLNPPSPVDLQVIVQRVEVLGSTVFSPAQIQDAVASFIGKQATFEELLAIRTAITKLYTDNGYTTSGAFLPSQDVTDGIVQIQVVEGGIERVDIQGLKRLRDSYVRDRLRSAIQAPINLRRLEAALQKLQLDPHLDSVQAELSAGTTPGLSLLTLNVTEAQPLSITLRGENRDSPTVGSLRGTVAIAHNNLLGLGDELSADYGISEGLNSYNLRYQIPINARDGTLSISYGHTKSDIIEEPFSSLDINADSQTFSLGFRQPIIHTPTQELALSLSLDLSQSQTFLLEDIPFSFSLGPDNGKSRITALRFTQEWTNRSARRVLAARSQFSFGLNAFNPTLNDSGVDGRFISWVGQFQWVESLSDNLILIARTSTQLTNDSLLPLEQFSIGGLDTVRGYRQNQRVADNGVVGSLEVRWLIINDPQGIGRIQLVPFFDIGTVWNHDDVEVQYPSTLASLGLGLRWQINPRFSAQLDWGIPLISGAEEGNTLQDKGIIFSLEFQAL